MGIRATTFTWSEQSREPVVSGNTRSFALRIDELTFEEGSINLIVGPTGSGKTALLWALLGMLTTVPLSPERCPDARFYLQGRCMRFQTDHMRTSAYRAREGSRMCLRNLGF